jgi:flagellar FliJ protein
MNGQMRFRFPFQKIVDLKSNEKMQAEWMLSSAVSRLDEEERSLDGLEQEKDRIQGHMVQSSETFISVLDLQIMQTYIHHLSSQISSKQQDVENAKLKVDDKQKDLSNRMLDEKVWNRAKEKAYIQYQATLQKKEQEQLDDMASVRYAARS